jgi:hypothetical protein
MKIWKASVVTFARVAADCLTEFNLLVGGFTDVYLPFCFGDDSD